jgi:hypothetical protein
MATTSQGCPPNVYCFVSWQCLLFLLICRCWLLSERKIITAALILVVLVFAWTETMISLEVLLWSFLRNLHRYVIVFDSLVWLGVCRVLGLQPGHKFYLLGHLSTEVGWHHYDTIKVWFLLPLVNFTEESDGEGVDWNPWQLSSDLRFGVWWGPPG